MTTDTVGLKIGSRWQSAVCDTEVIVVAAPAVPIVLTYGGQPMVSRGSHLPSGATLDTRYASGTVIGKRYEDAESSLELLCTKAGSGSLFADDRPLSIKQPKQLPSAD
ncbi:hypothetical protein [Frankia sp. Cas4]|uniref:hypothetical protein n=1 Tax=Frankia sp. Cas4 TaxID=3073927 RepID=UPI002AD4B06B|nr:hypothetical protein [Frankia sp. Cas4]